MMRKSSDTPSAIWYNARMKIRQILDKIDANQLFVPAFQREYKWGRNDAKNLIASLIHEYPTGTLLTWETNKPPALKGDWTYNELQGAVKLILDGQQRITTLYLLINAAIPPYYKPHEIETNPRGLYVNLNTLDLQYPTSAIKNDPLWVDITDIFQKTVRVHDVVQAIVERHPEFTREMENKIYDNYRAVETIPDHEFVEQTIPIHASLREAIDIFYIVNHSGITLTDAELALAQISGYWPEVREELKAKQVELKNHGFDFNLDFFVYCLLGAAHHVGSNMRLLHDEANNESLRSIWQNLKTESLDYAINLLQQYAYVDHSKEINSVYALIPIITYIHDHGTRDISQTDISKIVKWFYYSQIRQRYITTLLSKLDKDLGVIKNSANPFDELLEIISVERPLKINTSEFVGATVSNALYSMMRWFFKSRGAICFTTGMGIRQNMGSKYLLEADHIFASSVLRDNGYGREDRMKYRLAQEFTNRAVLTQVANQRKNAMDTAEYLRGVKERFPDALRLQSIPEDEELWKLENFEKFLQARRVLLADQLNEYLESLATTTAQTSVSLDEIIRDGESTELEFKSSLAWNYRNEQADKSLEKVIVKTIAAFNNFEGGTLLIGVDDDGNVLGLEPDYGELRGDKDEFELHLRDLMNNELGKTYTAANVKVSFPEQNGNEICKIDVQKGLQPIFLNVTDKNGVKSEKFYVRSGNSSQELSPSEASEYIASHFS